MANENPTSESSQTNHVSLAVQRTDEWDGLAEGRATDRKKTVPHRRMTWTTHAISHRRGCQRRDLMEERCPHW